MANQQRPYVNQRLYFASLHLDWMKAEIAKQQISRSDINQALGESVAIHLVMAYRCYLKELAVAYQLPVKPLQSAAQLAGCLCSEGMESAECHELLALERGGDWLSMLLAEVGLLEGESEPETPLTQSAGDIKFRAVKASALTHESLTAIYTALRALIEKQRNHLEEW